MMELLVVMAIITILAGMAIGGAQMARKRGAVTKAKAAIHWRKGGPVGGVRAGGSLSGALARLYSSSSSSQDRALYLNFLSVPSPSFWLMDPPTLRFPLAYSKR